MSSLERQGYEGFRQLAQQDDLSRYERIGFPDAYRAQHEAAIFADITAKLAPLATAKGLTILDIGAGCSDLPHMLIDLCERQSHRLVLIDSPEMLGQLPDRPFIEKVPGYFPDDHADLLTHYANKASAVLVYSVLHYVFAEGNLFGFVDSTLSLLADGGKLLLGDIPNISKRKRFFASPNGTTFHQKFTGTDTQPDVTFNTPEPTKIDDSVIFGLMSRARLAGFDSYLLPQPPSLPMANRREDILIQKP